MRYIPAGLLMVFTFTLSAYADLPPNDAPAGIISSGEKPSEMISNGQEISLTGTMRSAPQDIPVSGQVTAREDGTALPGVNILIKGTLTGTITDMNGEYKIDVPDENAILVFSSVGYLTQEREVGSNSVINVEMETDIRSLQEIVVTSLGIEKEVKALSYSVSELPGQELTTAQTINFGDNLVGRIAGVDVSNLGTGVGAAAKIRIRGSTSLTQNNEPLYVVDGIPMDNTRQEGGDQLSSINPEDIESISVLKGNSASALYGSRAANGVIMITTKRGELRRGLGVEFSSNFSINEMINVFTERQNEYGVGLGALKSQDFGFETHRAWGAKYDGSAGEYPNGDPTTYDYKEDHINEFFNTGYTWNNTIGLTAGSATQALRMSLSNMQHSDIVPNSGMDRTTAMLSTTSQFGSWLTVDAKLQYMHQYVKNRPVLWETVWPLLSIPTMWEIEHFKNRYDKIGAKEDGTMYNFSTNDYIRNPWWVTYQDVNNDTKDRVLGSVSARIDVTDWLWIQGRVGTDWSATKVTKIDAYGANQAAPQGRGRVREWVARVQETNMDVMVGFDKMFGDFGINAFVGGNRMRYNFERDGATGTLLNVPFYHVLQNASTIVTEYDFREKGINSAYGSLELSWKNLIYLTATGRNDWFSTLAPESNSIFYPSIGGSFVFSDAITLPSWLSFGKVRASWAQVGGGADTPYQTKFSYDIDALGHLGVPLASIGGTLPNRLLQPFESSEYEIGFDVRFLNNRLGIDYAYYNRTTKNDIATVDLPSSTSYDNAVVNLGQLSNWGHEILLTAVPIDRAVNWEFFITYSYNMSRVEDTGSETGEVTIATAGSGTAIKHIEGERYAAIEGYRHKVVDGVKYYYYDAGRATWGPQRSDEREILGYGYHPHSGSISNTFRWKAFTLNFLIDWKSGGSIWCDTNARMVQRGHHIITLEGRENGLYLEGVDANGNEEGPFYVPPENLENYYRRLYSERISELNVFDASYVKFRQITIGYQFPSSIMERTPLTNLRISLWGRNLFNIVDNYDNGDPAFANTETGNAAGLARNPLPSVRTFGIDLNLGF